VGSAGRVREELHWQGTGNTLRYIKSVPRSGGTIPTSGRKVKLASVFESGMVLMPVPRVGEDC